MSTVQTPPSSLVVLILQLHTRRNDRKIAGMKSDLEALGVRAIMTHLGGIRKEIQGSDTSWLCTMQDDMMVDWRRFVVTAKAFIRVARPSDVLVPFKYGDRCDVGVMLSKGDLYRQHNLNSVRGMVSHISVVKRLVCYSDRVRDRIPDTTLGVGASFEDPLGLIYPRSVMNTMDGLDNHEVVPPRPVRAETVSEEFGLQDPTVALEDVHFYTFYPNLIQWDSRDSGRT